MNASSTKKQQTVSYLLLLLGAFIWGSAFVSQRVGMDYLGPLAFNGIRNIIGSIVLVPFILITDKRKEKSALENEKKDRLPLIKAGIICGVLLALASSSQQYAIKYTSIGKVSFITTLYMIFVPILSVFFGKKIRPVLWLSALIATGGMYLLCLKGGEGFSLTKGEWLSLLCAVLFSFQIMALDKFSPMFNPVKIACVEFLTCGIICCVAMFIFEKPSISDVLSAYVPLLYAGVLSSGVAYTLQAVAQKHANPVTASLIMSTESVFCLLTSWLLLHETLSARELLGCGIILVAIIITQLPERNKETKAA